MDKDEMKRRFAKKIDEDDKFAANVEKALDADDDLLLAGFIAEVIGIVIEIGSAIWDWVIDTFS